jgi:hypothetical protein
MEIWTRRIRVGLVLDQVRYTYQSGRAHVPDAALDSDSKLSRKKSGYIQCMVLDVDIAAFGLAILSSANHDVAGSGLGDKIDVKADGESKRIRSWVVRCGVGCVSVGLIRRASVGE